METILFREKFADWPDNSRLIGVKEVKATEQKVRTAISTLPSVVLCPLKPKACSLYKE